jgi:D-glycero-alpha-D-manno-heptose-7-phosphate kinase
MEVHAIAPTRIDLAGGTLDIYPLYLFEGGGLTVNAAIDVCAEVWLAELPGTEVRIESLDAGTVVSAPSLDRLRPAAHGGGSGSSAAYAGLELIVRALTFYQPRGGIAVITRNQAPRGSGLGASSSLLMALCGALNEWTGAGHSPAKIINLGANLEAQTIRVPTGKQDYYAAVHGGVNAVWFGVDADHDRAEPLVTGGDAARALLEERLVLSFTGQPRFSAVTNWTMMRSYIDGEPATRDAMREIGVTAHAFRRALLDQRFDSLGPLLAREWENRRRLGPGVTTPRIDELMEAARLAGATASKICGAGGGGCMVTFAPEGARPAVAAALEAAGAQVIPYRIAPEGLRVRRTPAHGSL